MVKLFITMLDIRKLGKVLFMKRKKQVFRASLTFIALSFLLIGSLLNNKEDYFYRLKGETTYSCALPAGYVEINTIASTALTLTSHGGGNDYHNKVNTDTFRGTVTRKAGNTAYIQRRNQSNGELDSLYLWGVGTYSDLVPGAVIDISGGMIVNYYGNPEIKGFTYTVPFATNPYGYGPLVYNSVSDFNINAFTNIYDNSALNYSRLVKVKNVTLNALITEGDATSDSWTIRSVTLKDKDSVNTMNAMINTQNAAETNQIKALLNSQYETGYFDITGVLFREQNIDHLRIVALSDLSYEGTIIEPTYTELLIDQTTLPSVGGYATGNYGVRTIGEAKYEYYRVANTADYTFKMIDEFAVGDSTISAAFYNTTKIDSIAKIEINFKNDINASEGLRVKYGQTFAALSETLLPAKDTNNTYTIKTTNAYYFKLETVSNDAYINYIKLYCVAPTYDHTLSLSPFATSKSRINPITYSGSLVSGYSSVNVPLEIVEHATTYSVVTTKTYTYYNAQDVLDGIYTVAESALTDPVDVANYYIAFKEFPVNYFLKGSIPSEAYTTFGDYLRQVSEYNRTDGYAQAVPYRDADPYDGVNPYYYEFDIALPGLPYSTSNRGVGRVVIWQDGFDCTGYDYSPVAVYTDDHYATFQEFLNYGTYGERFNAEKSRTAYIYNAYNTLSPA